MIDYESDYESDYICEVSDDGDSICGREATRVVHEPYTPGNFELMCCEQHARSQIAWGYHPDHVADKRLAENKKREEETQC